MHLFIFKYRVTSKAAGRHRDLFYNCFTTVWLLYYHCLTCIFRPPSCIFHCLTIVWRLNDYCMTCIFLLNPARGVAASLMYDCPCRARFKPQFKVSNYSIFKVKGKTSLFYFCLSLPPSCIFLHFPLPDMHFLLPDNRRTIEWLLNALHFPFESSKGRCHLADVWLPLQGALQASI